MQGLRPRTPAKGVTPLEPDLQKLPFLRGTKRRRQIKVSVKPFQRLAGFGTASQGLSPCRRFFEWVLPSRRDGGKTFTKKRKFSPKYPAKNPPKHFEGFDIISYLIVALSFSRTSWAPPSTRDVVEITVIFAFSCSSGIDSTPQLHIVDFTFFRDRPTLSRRLPA